MYWGEKGLIIKKTNGKEPVGTLASEKPYFRVFFTSNYCGVGKGPQVPFIRKSPKIPYHSPWLQASLLFYRRIWDFLIIHSRGLPALPLKEGSWWKKRNTTHIKTQIFFPVPAYTGKSWESSSIHTTAAPGSSMHRSPQWSPLSLLVSSSLFPPTRLKRNCPVSCTTPIFRISRSTLPFLSQSLFKPSTLMWFAISALSLSLYSAHWPPWGGWGPVGIAKLCQSRSLSFQM